MIVKVNVTQNLGYGLTLHLEQLGWMFYRSQDGNYYVENNEPQPERPVELDEEGQPLPLPPLELPEVQALIDGYNPWPYEKSNKLKEINEWFKAAVAQLTSGIPQEEKDSWATQVNEANGIIPLQMLPVMAHARGITVEELIQRVKTKAGLFAQYYGGIQGKRDAVEDAIKALPDNGELHRLPELWSLSCMD